MVLVNPGLVFGAVRLYLVGAIVSVLFMTFTIAWVIEFASLLGVSTLGFRGKRELRVTGIVGVKCW